MAHADVLYRIQEMYLFNDHIKDGANFFSAF